MNVDTEIRHVTKAGDNIFLELGFDEDEATCLYAESQQYINDTKALKEQLMNEISQWIADNHFKQVEAAQILGVTRPRISDLVNKKVSKFTFDALLNMLNRIGKTVKLAVS
ncbi:MAG: XRE family transcriptional regulator [Methylococcales bacterium]|nr:XRE family transcriptional regulator [Methylococcales bacterium]